MIGKALTVQELEMAIVAKRAELERQELAVRANRSIGARALAADASAKASRLRRGLARLAERLGVARKVEALALFLGASAGHGRA